MSARSGRSKRSRRSSRAADRAPRPLDSDLPLEDLDAALAPVRRAAAFALRSGTVPPHLPEALLPHLRRAARVDLPDPLGALLGTAVELGEALVGAEEPEAGLQALFVHIGRIDALLGLPVPRRLRAPNKRRYAPQPEPRLPEAPSAPEPPPRPEPTWGGRADDDLEDVLPGSGLGGMAVADVLSLEPVSHEPVDGPHGAGRPVETEGLVAVGGRVRARTTICRADGRREERLLLVGAGPMWCRWTGPAPHPSLLSTGERCVLVGTVSDGELVDAEVAGEPCTGRARYDTSDLEDVSEEAIREALVRLRPLIDRLRDPVSGEALRSLDLPGRGRAALARHAADAEERERGRRRRAYDEVLLTTLGATGQQSRGDRGIPHTVLHTGPATLERFGVELDDQQAQVFEDVKRDLRRSTPMRRLLTGEVGAGKGSVALMAMALVAESKAQVLVVGPDAAEAEHRFLHTEPLLRELGLVARRLPDDPGDSLCDAIRRGEIHVVFGTHALLSADLPFRRLGLVVSVERFPFGSAAVANLPSHRPDLLVLTQVPVGSRLLATAYADFEVSVVRHTVRRPARIEVVRAAQRDRAYESLREAVATGQQGTVLFPRVGGADALGLVDANRVVKALEQRELADCRVGLLHGQQSLDEQRRVYEDFRHRRVDVLVTTLSLEDGPCVPGLVATVVEQADHVEQWRLHRVIGFLSTTPLPSVAVLVVGEHASTDAEARVQRVLDAPDGYALTEARVDVRGLAACVVPGVPPLPTYQDFDPSIDLELALAARQEAHRVLRADPSLRRGSHQELARELREGWSELWPEADAAWSCPFSTPSDGGDRKRRRRRRRRR